MTARGARTDLPAPDPRAADGEILLVDKPKGWTSFDVVNKLRRMLRVKKIGHAGTLDPMATGLLILCTSRRTRDLASFMGLEKEYEGELELGATTASYDAETPILERNPVDAIRPEEIAEAFGRFVGTQEQLPPMYSAVKQKGKRLYELARKGVEVERATRTVEIRSIRITGIEMPRVRFTVVCSKGTYVRTLVHDLGAALGCGAYLTALRRTRIGEFTVRDAWTIERLAESRTAGPNAG
jgi:tRNA pseudouridine55 synthase